MFTSKLMPSSLIIVFVFSTMNLALSEPHESPIPKTASGKDFDIILDINKELEWINKFNSQAQALLQWRIKNVGEETAFREIVGIYNKILYRSYYVRTMAAFEEWAKQSGYTEWESINPHALGNASAVAEFYYDKSMYSGSTSILFTSDPINPRSAETRALVETYNHKNGIVSKEHLRMGEFFIDELKKAAEIKYQGESLTSFLGEVGHPWD